MWPSGARAGPGGADSYRLLVVQVSWDNAGDGFPRVGRAGQRGGDDGVPVRSMFVIMCSSRCGFRITNSRAPDRALPGAPGLRSQPRLRAREVPGWSSGSRRPEGFYRSHLDWGRGILT
jgi:hypothetical protein